MTILQTNQIIDLLKAKDVQFDQGLSDVEVNKIQQAFNITFPPDLKRFLQTALPVSDGFVDWRKGLSDPETANAIVSRIQWPLEGLLFDVKENNYWIDAWGDQPTDDKTQAVIATKYYHTYPALVPIYSHRYIPSEPNEIGNPVFSIHQMDIIYYGYDLANYFSNEFGFVLPSAFKVLEHPNKNIDFWSSAAE